MKLGLRISITQATMEERPKFLLAQKFPPRSIMARKQKGGNSLEEHSTELMRWACGYLKHKKPSMEMVSLGYTYSVNGLSPLLVKVEQQCTELTLVCETPENEDVRARARKLEICSVLKRKGSYVEILFMLCTCSQ